MIYFVIKSVTAAWDEHVTLCAYFPSTPFLYSSGAVHSALRLSISSSDISNDISFLSESTVTRSPSRRKAIGPPACASGEMCPTTRPCVPPENRRSEERRVGKDGSSGM